MSAQHSRQSQAAVPTVPSARGYRWRLLSITALGTIMLALAGLFALYSDGFYGDGRPQETPAADASSPLLENDSPHVLDNRRAVLSVSSLRTSPSPLAEEFAAVDPNRDGSPSEVFHERAKAQLKKLTNLLAGPRPIEEDKLAELSAREFRCGPLRPEQLGEVFRDGTLQVLRPSSKQAENAIEYRGVAGFRAALAHWLAPLAGATARRCDFKIFRIDASKTGTRTSAYITLSGRTATGSHQQNATWRCTWDQPTGTMAPRLTSISIEQYEQVIATTDRGQLFGDCTEAVLGANRCFRDQLAYDEAHWCSRIESQLGMYIRSLSGLAVGDVNGDGRDDLYVCEPGGLPNRLFIQDADGTARDASDGSGVDLLEPSRSALIADLDNDGDQDMVVMTIYSAVAVFRGDGTGRFSLVHAIPVRGTGYSIAAADFDNDGLLDLYVCVFSQVKGEIGEDGGDVPEPYYDANSGSPNVLLRNTGELRFSDVTAKVGLDVNNRRYSYAASWEDFDNDGDLDLYVANDFGRNNLYRNDEGRFIDVAPTAVVEDIASGMGVTWGDFDNDGRMDVYVANMWSSAGNRITFQPNFTVKRESARPLIQRLARGNTLFHNAGGGSFRDASISANVTMGRWAWGAHFVDVNNDGWDDLVIPNGFVSGQTSDDL